MSMPKEGESAPDFRVVTDEGQEAGLSDFRGKKIVLYFYPKDDTPGCTTEACSFRDGLVAIREKGAVVLGVSCDTVECHKKFKEKFKLTFPLLSDHEKKIVQDYGVWGEKSFAGKKYMGIFRTTFLIDEKGMIQKVFPNVKPDVHFQEVLNAL